MTNVVGQGSNYGHAHDDAESDGYLVPKLVSILKHHAPEARRLFDLGAGNGGSAGKLQTLGYEITGVEPSPEGVAMANEKYPTVRIEVGSGYDDLRGLYGTFDVVYSLEVIEHVYDPRTLVRTALDLVKPGGCLILSTPYHGYWKNLLIALTGKFDSHFTALWDHGHIKFWSPATLGVLLKECGAGEVEFQYAGRFMPIAKSMFAIVRKPE